MPRGRHGNHVRGSRHPRWNEGRMLSDHGYVKVRVGIEHPFADPNGYAYEHELVWVSASTSGRVPPGHVIHHSNEHKTDNQLANLELLTRAEHNQHHAHDRDAAGRFVGKKAAGCEFDGRTWDEMPRGGMSKQT